MTTYIKKETRIIKGKKRNIYTKKNSRTKYIKSKGRMVNLKTYLKTIKRKKIGGTKNTLKQQILQKAKAVQERINLGLVDFYKSPNKNSPNKNSPIRSRKTTTKIRSSRSDSSSPLPKPTNYFR